VPSNLQWIRAQVENSPDTFDHLHEAFVPRQIYSREEACSARFRPDVDGACYVADFDRAAIEFFSDDFHSGGCPLSKEPDKCGPVEGRPIREPNQETRLTGYRLEVAAEAAELARRVTARRPHGMVELPNALESSGKGNLGYW